MKKSLILIIMTVSAFCLNAWDFELDTNKDGKPDRFINAEADKKWEINDINRNKIPDESCFYVSDKKIIYRIFSEEQDYDHDGKTDIWIEYEYQKANYYSIIRIDTNGDGEADFITYKKNDFVQKKEYDLDGDGKFESVEEFKKLDKYVRKEYFQDKLTNVVYDVIEVKKSEDNDGDGKFDAWFWKEEHYHGKQLVAEKPTKEEFDKNGDGKVDIWMEVTYGPDGHMKSVVTKYDSNFDGKVDEWRYANQRGEVVRQEFDFNGDGRIDKVVNNPTNLIAK